jgi:quercetin dioxygenase-like cupin family protein
MEEASNMTLINTPVNDSLIEQYGRPDLVCQAVPDDERLWVPQEPNVWFRPLILNVTQGAWTTVLRVKKSGILSRHRHPAPVYGYVIRGSWRYLEHDWTASEGMFVFEPPGETHTLVVEEGQDDMMTFFQVSGAMIYMDDQGSTVGFDDVFTKIDRCRRHFEAVGLGSTFVERFIR